MTNNDFIPYGGDMMIWITSGGTACPMAYTSAAKLSTSMKPRTRSHKDNGEWTDKVKGKYDWNGSTDSLMNFSTLSGSTFTGNTFNVDDVYALYLAGELVNMTFGSKSGTSPSWTVSSSVKKFSGTILITNMDFNANDGEDASYSMTFEGSGPLSLT
jgi:hypothetical protein